MRPPLAAVASVSLAAAMVGCSDPYRAGAPAAVDGEQPAPHVEHHDPPAQTEATPPRLIRRAVQLSGTWTSRTVASQYAALARLTVEPARQQASEAAARIATDRQLTATGSASTTTLEELTFRGRGRRQSAIVVTRERLRADGHTTTRWRVTLATAIRTGSGWALARWEPQP